MGCAASSSTQTPHVMFPEAPRDPSKHIYSYDILPPPSISKKRESIDGSLVSSYNNSEKSQVTFVPNAVIGRQFTIDTSRAKSNAQVVSLCASQLGLQEFPVGREDGGDCDIYWHNVVYHDMKSMVRSVNARVNRFPGMTDLSKKISLTRAIASMRTLFPDEYEFYPKSWFLPAQFNEFLQHCKGIQEDGSQDQQRQEDCYIVKPDDGAQGTGIYLINSPDQLKDTTTKQLIQEYISDPFLLGDSLKFDFRVYAVIKSINPLSIHVAREGMARFCTEKYSRPTTSNFDNLYAHLTNYSLNKANGHYIHSNSLQDQIRGSKRLLSTVFHQMEARGVKTKRLWHNIKLIIVKTVLAMVPEIMINYEHYFHDIPGPQCFQIMGFDILVTADLTPILLEVNSSPSLTIEHSIPTPNEDKEPENVEQPKVRSIVDEVIKIPLVMDTILLVLDLINDVYSARSPSSTSVLSDRLNHAKRSIDDMSTLTLKKKSHLSEIFPSRYGQCSGHLLFLDKAVYLYMQFVNLRQTSVMTIAGARSFLRKCNLSNSMSLPEMERKFAEIYCHFTGEQYTSISSGLTFHGFLTLVYAIAKAKFPFCEDMLGSVQRLLAYCDVSLRHYGVRSARLRRTQIDNDKENSVEIYLLPSRLKEKRPSRPLLRSKSDGVRKGRSRYARSLPRNMNMPTSIKEETNNERNRDRRLVLPKIRPPFLV